MGANRTKVDQFLLRLPDGLRDRLKQRAESSDRSMNQIIVHMLETALDDPAADDLHDLKQLRRFLDNEISRLQSSEAG